MDEISSLIVKYLYEYDNSNVLFIKILSSIFEILFSLIAVQ